MILSPTRRNLGKIAAILGILQGLAWAAMSLAAIILHYWSPDFEIPTTYSKFLEALIYSHFVLGNDYSIFGSDFIIRPLDFTIFMWIYFLLSVGWMALSFDQLTAIYYQKQRQTTIMILWGIITLIVSLLDLIFTSLLVRDYTVCSELSTVVTQQQYFCYLTIGIVMTIAARGYTLWVVNLVLSILMFYVSANIKKENNSLGSLFSNHSIPRVTIPRANNERSSDDPFPRGQPVTPEYLSGSGTQAPSFLSRGEKFSY